MKTQTLQDLFLIELADMFDAEKRLIKALPKMAKVATCNDLKVLIETHLKESEGHLRKLEQVFECFNEKPFGKTCEATKGLLEEGDKMASSFKDSPAINAALIASLQKIEHYEVASYGCLHAWAGLLGNQRATALIEAIMKEEKATNEGLTRLAVTKSNQEAMG